MGLSRAAVLPATSLSIRTRRPTLSGSPRKIVLTLLLAAIAALYGLFAADNAQEGRVIAIKDGDTLEIIAEGKPVRVRLAEIDTPEKAQPWGMNAKQILSDLCHEKQARIVEQDRDRYGRVVARVYCEGVDANAELVRQGAAWVYRQYAADPALFNLEDDARQASRGLWALPAEQRIPPWEWRRQHPRGKSG